MVEHGRDALGGETRCVVQPEVEPARSAGLRAYLVVHGEQGDALAVGVENIRARGEKKT